MSLKVLENFLSFFIILESLVSGGFASVDISLAGNRNVLCNAFEKNYFLGAINKDTIKMFQPLLIDYTFLQYFYVNSSNEIWNPIRSSELHNAKFYSESSALIEKSRDQIFADFYIKYNAVLAFLDLWIARFVIKYTMLIIPKDKAARGKIIHENFLSKLDEMAYYAQWLVNLEIHRHLDEINSTLRYSLPTNDREFPKVVSAFGKIIRMLNALIRLEPFSSEIRQKIFEFDQKVNPYSEEITPIEIKDQDQDDKWMRRIQHIENVKAENFFTQPYDDYDKEYNPEHVNDPRKYMKYLHDKSWAAIDIIVGEELFILESFFYSSLTGWPYTLSKSFVPPDFNFTKELWKELECIYYYWKPVTAKRTRIDETCKKSAEKYFMKGYKEENELYLIKILRDIDSLRFPEFDLLNANADFTLKTCRETFFLRRCHGSFRMLVAD